MPALTGSKPPHPEISSVLSLLLPLDFRGEVIAPRRMEPQGPRCVWRARVVLTVSQAAVHPHLSVWYRQVQTRRESPERETGDGELRNWGGNRTTSCRCSSQADRECGRDGVSARCSSDPGEEETCAGWMDARSRSLAPPGYSPAAYSGPSWYCPGPLQRSSASYSTGLCRLFSAPPTWGSRGGSYPGSFSSGNVLSLPLRKPRPGVPLSSAPPLVPFLSVSALECWLQPTCSRNSGQYSVNPAPAVCTSYEQQEIDRDALPSTQTAATDSEIYHRPPRVYLTSLSSPAASLAPLWASLSQLPFSPAPLQVSTSSRIRLTGRGRGMFSHQPCVSGTLAHQEAFPMLSPGLRASSLPPSEPSSLPLDHPLGPPQRSLPGCPGPCQATCIWFPWNGPSGPAGHQVLPALLIRAPHEAGQGGPPEAGRKRDRLAPWSQGLDVSPLDCVHEEGWEELPGQKLQVRIDQDIFPEQVDSLKVQEPTGDPDTHPDSASGGILWKMPMSISSMSGQAGAHLRQSPNASEKPTQD